MGGHGAARLLPADVRKAYQGWVGGSGGLDGTLNLKLELSLSRLSPAANELNK